MLKRPLIISLLLYGTLLTGCANWQNVLTPVTNLLTPTATAVPATPTPTSTVVVIPILTPTPTSTTVPLPTATPAPLTGDFTFTVGSYMSDGWVKINGLNPIEYGTALTDYGSGFPMTEVTNNIATLTYQYPTTILVNGQTDSIYGPYSAYNGGPATQLPGNGLPWPWTETYTITQGNGFTFEVIPAGNNNIGYQTLSINIVGPATNISVTITAPQTYSWSY